MFKIPSNGLSELKKNGYISSQDILSKKALSAVIDSLEQWKKTPAINGYGCIHHSNDALLQNLGLYSECALKLALSEELLDFLEDHFGERVVLSKLEYRRALVHKPEMPLHSDGTKDLLVFIYLNGVGPETGMTAVVPGSHKIGTSKNEGLLQVPKNVYEESGVSVLPISGPAGTCLIFEANIWHSRIGSIRSGREILWFSYSPISNTRDCIDLVFSRSSLLGLSDRQIDALGLRNPSLGNKKGEDFRMSKQLGADSLYLSPTRLIFAALLFNFIFRLRLLVPKKLKLIYRYFSPVKISRKKTYS
jgi:hypothetical protein